MHNTCISPAHTSIHYIYLHTYLIIFSLYIIKQKRLIENILTCKLYDLQIILENYYKIISKFQSTR